MIIIEKNEKNEIICKNEKIYLKLKSGIEILIRENVDGIDLMIVSLEVSGINVKPIASNNIKISIEK